MRKYPLILISLLMLVLLAGCRQGSLALDPTAPGAQAPPARASLPVTQESAVQGLTKPTFPASQPAMTATVNPAMNMLPAGSATEESQLPTATSTQAMRPTLAPGAWKELPVIPQISPNAVAIYQRGVELGNNPQAFSKIGDCGSTPAWFLGDFDRGPRFYRLGNYQELDRAIQYFQGSFNRTSLAAKAGFNASSIYSPLWSNSKECQPSEAPLLCEYRVHRPTLAFIMLGSNDVYHPDEFEPQMRRIIEDSIAQGVLPILSTKADNLEGDGSINAKIASLANEYDLPLWNYWRALQDLPDAGLQEDQVHITWAPNRFDDPAAMSRGWPVRNLNALQILDAIYLAVNPSPNN